MASSSIDIQVGEGELVQPLPFTIAEYHRRLSGLRTIMTRIGIDAMVSFTPENIYYLTSHDTPGYYYLQACVTTMDDDPVVVTRKIESFNTLGRSWSRRVVPFGDTEDPVEKLVQLVRQLGMTGKRIGLEADAWFITPRRYAQLVAALESMGAHVVDASGTVEQLRLIKSNEEISYIRQGGRICSAAMRAAFSASRSGVPETEVAAAAVGRMIAEGGQYAGLPPFISTGSRTSLVHSTWSDKLLSEGDVLAYEIPGVRERYCAALYRTGVVGKPSPEIQRGCDILVETLEALLAAARPGEPASVAHQAGAAVFGRHGISVPPRRSAYALGVNYPPDWGEGHIMSFTANESRELLPGMVFHVGTGIFEYPRYQLAFTETIVVTEGGIEVLTDFPRQLTIV